MDKEKEKDDELNANPGPKRPRLLERQVTMATDEPPDVIGPAIASRTRKRRTGGAVAVPTMKRRGTMVLDERPPLLASAGCGIESAQAATLTQLGFFGPNSSRSDDWLEIQGEFLEITGSLDHTIDEQSFIAAAHKHWKHGSNTRVLKACFTGCDYDDTHLINLHEFALFHAAIIRYNDDRDHHVVELHIIRMRILLAYYDDSQDGALQSSELKELVRGMCSGDTHVGFIVNKIRVDSGSTTVTRDRLLELVAQGLFRRHHLFTRDLLKPFHFGAATRLSVLAEANKKATTSKKSRDMAKNALKPVPESQQHLLLVSMGLIDTVDGPALRENEEHAAMIEYLEITKGDLRATIDRATFVAEMKRRHSFGVRHGRLADACFRAFDLDQNGTMSFLEYLLYKGAIDFYDPVRDLDNVAMNRMRMNTVFNIYDLDSNGVLSVSELTELVRDMCIGEGHVRKVMHELDVPMSSVVDECMDVAGLLKAVSSGTFARCNLSTRDLQVLRMPDVKRDTESAERDRFVLSLHQQQVVLDFAAPSSSVIERSASLSSSSASFTIAKKDSNSDTDTTMNTNTSMNTNTNTNTNTHMDTNTDTDTHMDTDNAVVSPPVGHRIISGEAQSLKIRLRVNSGDENETQATKEYPESTEDLCLLVTTEISKIADPADHSTNMKYSSMCKLIEVMLRQLIPCFPAAQLVQWEHKMTQRLWVDYAGPPAVPILPRSDTNNFSPYFVQGASREASDEELVRSSVHTLAYIKKMQGRTARAVKQGTLVELNDSSAGFTSMTEQAARVASGALIDTTIAVWQRRFRTAFVMCRPPTHHAVGNAGCCRNQSPKNLPFGFCHLNGISAAIAAVWDKAKQTGLEEVPRIAIIDIDVHHGNANEDTWFKSKDVLHINFNEKGIWPGPEHGDPAAVGEDDGVGFNRNFPMPTAEGDAAYTYAMTQYALCDVEEFEPALIIIACGLDAMAGDPYARMDVSPTWYGWFAAELRERDICPVVFNLEGGYSPDKCAVAISHVIAGLTTNSSQNFLRSCGLLVAASGPEECDADHHYDVGETVSVRWSGKGNVVEFYDGVVTARSTTSIRVRYDDGSFETIDAGDISDSVKRVSKKSTWGQFTNRGVVIRGPAETIKTEVDKVRQTQIDSITALTSNTRIARRQKATH